MTDIKHAVYSHEDVRSRYSLILGLYLYNDWPSHAPGRYYTSYSCTHSEIDAAHELTMNRKIVTSYCICGDGPFTTKFWHGALIDGKQVILSSSISSHYTAVVDMTVVTTKNLLRLNISLMIFPTGSVTEIILVSRLNIHRGKVSQPPSPLCSCSVRSIVVSSPVSSFL